MAEKVTTPISIERGTGWAASHVVFGTSMGRVGRALAGSKEMGLLARTWQAQGGGSVLPAPARLAPGSEWGLGLWDCPQ